MDTTPLEWTLIFLVVAVPVLGVTARIAVRPIVDAIVRLREAFGAVGPGAAPDPRLERLEAEVLQLRAEVGRLREGEAFRDAFAAPPAGPGLPPAESPAR